LSLDSNDLIIIRIKIRHEHFHHRKKNREPTDTR
jgi:hypothetical protein